jgi:hypothetical protein
MNQFDKTLQKMRKRKAEERIPDARMRAEILKYWDQL